MTCINCLVFLVLTVLIPLRLTYRAIKEKDTNKQIAFAIYWSFFFTIRAILSFLTFLQGGVTEFLLMIFFLWLYHENYLGALFLRDLLINLENKQPAVKDIMSKIRQFTGVLKIFQEENKPKVE